MEVYLWEAGNLFEKIFLHIFFKIQAVLTGKSVQYKTRFFTERDENFYDSFIRHLQ